MKNIFVAIYYILALLQMAEGTKAEKHAKEQNSALRTRICGTRPEYGLCKGHRMLWFYNVGRQRCELFEYSNCGGNRNKFFSEEHCVNFCIKKIRS